jgi:hypothetical protein
LEGEKIMLTNKQFDSFRKETEQAMQQIAEKYGVNIHCGKIKYSDIKFDLTITASKKEVNGKSVEQIEFEKVATLYGFVPNDFGKSFTWKGNTYRIVGIKTRASKMPIICECTDGKRYKFAEDVKKLITA